VFPLYVVGLVLIAAGYVRQWSLVALGRLFTVDVRMHRGQTVVDRRRYAASRRRLSPGLW
jgi:hypothetical protein